MTQESNKLSFVHRLKWWLYERCFTYCVHAIHPYANPDEFCILDRTGFVALSRDEARELMEEAPDSAWRLESLLKHG